MSCCNTQNICLFSGDDLRVFIEVYDTTGAPVDISSAESIVWAFAKNADSSIIVQKTLGVDLFIANPTSFFFDLVPADTDTISGSYYHEARIVTDQDLIYTGVSGQLKIKKSLIQD